MLIYVIRVSIKTHQNTVNYGRCLREIHLGRKKRRKKMGKKSDILWNYLSDKEGVGFWEI
jgi:hypothetical protein